jgi:hypothetical protein
MSHQHEVQKQRKNFQSLSAGERSCDLKVALLGLLYHAVVKTNFVSKFEFECSISLTAFHG